MRSMMTALAAPALLVPLLAVDAAQAASTWSAPRGVSVELSAGVVGAIATTRGGDVFLAGNFATSDPANPTFFTFGQLRDGTLTPMPGAPSGAVSALAWDPTTSTLYAGGSIIMGTSAYGVVKWDGTAWSGVADMDFGMASALAVDSDGTLYVGGAFRTINGQAGFGGFAQLSTTGWSSLGRQFNDDVTSIAIDRRDRVYVAGRFSGWIAGSGTFGSVAVWNGDSWSVVGATNGNVLTVAIGPGDALYGHGSFTEASGVATRLAVIPASATEWQAVPAPPAEVTQYGASQMSFTADGSLLIGIDGRIYSLKNESWTTIPGVFGGPIRTVVSDAKGTLIAGGAFTSIDRVRTPGLAVRSNAQRPKAPRTVSAEDLGRRVLVQWSAVSSTPPVTRYEAECRKGSPQDAQKLIVQGRAATFDVPARGNYRCRVRAENSVGWSPWSRTVTVSVR